MTDLEPSWRPPIQRVIDSFDGQPCTWIRPSDAPSRSGEPCGIIHDRCTGHQGRWAKDPETRERIPNPTYADPCGQPAKVGAVKCRIHLRGRLERQRQRDAATVDQIERRLGRILGDAHATVAGRNAVESLQDARLRADAWTVAIGAELARLAVESDATVDVVYSETGIPHVDVEVRRHGLIGPDSAGNQTLHVLGRMYESAMERQAKVAKLAIDVGIEERRTDIEAGQRQVLVDALKATLAAKGVTWDAGVAAILGAELRARDVIEATGAPTSIALPVDDDGFDDWDDDEEPAPAPASVPPASWLDEFGPMS